MVYLEPIPKLSSCKMKFHDSKETAQLMEHTDEKTSLFFFYETSKIIKDCNKIQNITNEKSISDLFVFLFNFTFKQIKTIRESKKLELEFLEKNELKNYLKNGKMTNKEIFQGLIDEF
jgi:hypothetical protein